MVRALVSGPLVVFAATGGFMLPVSAAEQVGQNNSSRSHSTVSASGAKRCIAQDSDGFAIHDVDPAAKLSPSPLLQLGTTIRIDRSLLTAAHGAGDSRHVR